MFPGKVLLSRFVRVSVESLRHADGEAHPAFRPQFRMRDDRFEQLRKRIRRRQHRHVELVHQMPKRFARSSHVGRYLVLFFRQVFGVEVCNTYY